MKCITTVIVLLVATVASAEDTRKWYSVAYSIGSRSSYGVAWNFPTRAAAESAAAAECEKRARHKCEASYSEHDHCFAIIRSDAQGWRYTEFVHYTGPVGPVGYITEDEHPNSLFQTEEEARHLATEKIRENNRRYGQWRQESLEFVACSGDPRNRRATK